MTEDKSIRLDGINKGKMKSKTTAPVSDIHKNETDQKPVNKRRELLKGLAGLPLLAGFTGILGKNTIENRSYEEAVADKISRVTEKRLAELEGSLPKGKLGTLEITRMIMGCNQISGYAHARDLIYSNTLFKEYNTTEKVIETFHLAEMSGINTTFITNPNFPVFHKYQNAYGGKLQTICQTYLRGENILADIDLAINNGATALYFQGGDCDRLVRDGKVDSIRKAVEYAKKKGYLTGIGGHAITTIKTCEEAGIPADFYVKTFHHDKYWSAHPVSQRVEFSVDNQRFDDHDKIHDNMFDLFSEKTAAYMEGISKPWIAFKVLAGGALQPKDGFRYAFENGADFICVGMFDFQMVSNINTASQILASLKTRERPWYS
jgi:hypothetical protein